MLYICVFGESLLNDAITVVLYNMFDAFVLIGESEIIAIDVVAAASSFFVVSLGGLLIGLLWALVIAFTTK